MTRRQSASVTSSLGTLWAMPAMLAKTSMRPCMATVASVSARTEAESVTSVSTKRASLPRRSAAAWPSAAKRSARTTFAPLSAIALAISKPMPRLPPVTMATRPSKEKMGKLGMGERVGKGKKE